MYDHKYKMFILSSVTSIIGKLLYSILLSYYLMISGTIFRMN